MKLKVESSKYCRGRTRGSGSFDDKGEKAS